MALLATSLAASLLLAELVLRVLFGPPVHFVHPQESYAFDAEVGHALVPGDRAYTHDAPVRVNAAGLRGAEIGATPPPGTRRILALGDSQTFGNGLALAETWPALLERDLARAHPALDVQVLNGGISGTDTWQHARLLQRWAHALHPDAVILGFYVNDVARRSPPTPRALTNSRSQRAAYLLKRSALISFAWGVTRQVAALRSPGGDREQRLLRGEPDHAVAEGWEQVETSLREMKRLCDRRGLPFALAVLPRRDQIDGRIASRAYNRRIGTIAAKLGIPSVDLLEPLRHAWARDGDALFIAWDGHHSGRANRVIAEAIGQALGPLLLGGPAQGSEAHRAAALRARSGGPSAPSRTATAP